MQKIIIGLVFAVAIISLATLPLGIAASSYAQKTTTNLDKNSIKGSLTSIQNDASTLKPAWIVSGVFRIPPLLYLMRLFT
jgi:hypothetical protein